MFSPLSPWQLELGWGTPQTNQGSDALGVEQPPHTPLKMMPWYTLTQVEFLHTRFACRCLPLASINIWETSSQFRLADASRKRPQHLVVADISWFHMFTTWATKKMVPFLNPFWRPFIGFKMFYISFCGIHIGMLSSSNGRKGDVWPQGDRAFRKAGGRGAKDSQHLGKERGRPWWHNKLYRMLIGVANKIWSSDLVLQIDTQEKVWKSEVWRIWSFFEDNKIQRWSRWHGKWASACAWPIVCCIRLPSHHPGWLCICVDRDPNLNVVFSRGIVYTP